MSRSHTIERVQTQPQEQLELAKKKTRGNVGQATGRSESYE